MGRATFGDVRDGSLDPRVVRDSLLDSGLFTGHVEGPPRRFGTSGGTVGEVRDLSGEHWGGLGMVGGPSGRSEMGRGTVREVRDGSGDRRGGPGRVGGLSGRSGTDRWTLG